MGTTSGISLEPLQILDECPALGFAETGPELVAAIAVAIGIVRIGHEGAAPEGRLIGDIPDALGVEYAAANHEGRLPLFGRRQQLPQVRYRAVVQIRRRRPDAVQGSRFIGRATGRRRRRLEQEVEIRRNELLDLIDLLLSDLAEIDPLVGNDLQHVLAKRAPQTLFLTFRVIELRLLEHGADDRDGENIERLRSMLQPWTDRQRRNERSPENSRIDHPLRLHDHFRIGADRPDRRGPRADEGRLLAVMAAFAVFLEQRFALLCESLVEAEDRFRPWWRAQLDDLLFQTLQGDEIRRRVAVPNGRRSRRGVGTDPLRLEVGERPEHLAGIARERLNEEAVGEARIPLRAILPRRVPQERIADRRIGDLEIARDAEVAAGHAIDDHSKRIDPPWPPWRRRREADVHDVPELLDPSAEVDPELGRLGGRIAAAQDRLGKSIETIRLRQRGAGRSSQIGKKLLKVGICRRTVETHDMSHAILAILELRGVAGSARQAEVARRRIAGDGEADRQPFGVALRFFIVEIAVALQLVAAKRRVDVQTAERLEPRVGDQKRALARGVE